MRNRPWVSQWMPTALCCSHWDGGAGAGGICVRPILCCRNLGHTHGDRGARPQLQVKQRWRADRSTCDWVRLGHVAARLHEPDVAERAWRKAGQPPSLSPPSPARASPIALESACACLCVASSMRHKSQSLKPSSGQNERDLACATTVYTAGS